MEITFVMADAADCRLKLHPVMSNQDVCQVGTLLTLLDGSLAALSGAIAVDWQLTAPAQLASKRDAQLWR